MKTLSKANFALRFSLILVALCLISLEATRVLADPGGVRTGKYSQQDIIPVRAKLRFPTLIVLSQNEDILDFATGGKEFWIIKRVHNLCYVHPAQAGIRSDLHLITSTGRVYSFLLMEISNEPSAEPDLKLLVEPKDKSSIGGVTALQGYVRASEAEAYKKELQALHAQTDGQIHAAEARMAGQVNKYKADYQKKLLFDYELDKKAPRELFLVSMIYYDDAVTYIMCAAQEKPALYEIKDGKPNLWPSSETSTTLSSSISSKNLGSGPSSARRSRSSSSAISASTVLFGAAVLIEL